MSPALAFSTISWRIITSSDLGREPAGISLEVSCIRTLCQSANLLSCRSNAHLALFAQVALTQMVGFKPTITTTYQDHPIIVNIHYRIYIMSSKTKCTLTSVYLYCCSTFLITPPHSKHLKVPWRSSGRTSLVRVTTPFTDTSFPISAVVNSLNL